MNSVVWADLHVDHEQACKARGYTVKEFQELISDTWIKCVTPRTTAILVGDIALFHSGLLMLKKLPGKKILVMGNHDTERENDIRDLLEVFDDIKGLWHPRKRKLSFSHAPQHPQHLRGRKNVHGHIHTDIIPDERYVNVCWDHLQDGPVDLERIITGEYTTYSKK